MDARELTTLAATTLCIVGCGYVAGKAEGGDNRSGDGASTSGNGGGGKRSRDSASTSTFGNGGGGSRSCDGTPHGGVDPNTRVRFKEEIAPTEPECQSEEQTRTCNDGTWGQWSGTYTFETCTGPWPGPCTKTNDSGGTVYQRTTYTYDAQGNELSWELDKDGDGTVDYREKYTYDAQGNRLSDERRYHG